MRVDINVRKTHNNQDQANILVNNREVEKPQGKENSFPHHGHENDEYDVSSTAMSKSTSSIDIRYIGNITE